MGLDGPRKHRWFTSQQILKGEHHLPKQLSDYDPFYPHFFYCKRVKPSIDSDTFNQLFIQNLIKEMLDLYVSH